MKKAICFMLCAMFLALPAFAVTSAAPLSGITAPSALLIHPSGEILFEKNPHEKRNPASVTKIMTMLLVMEAIERGDLKMTDMVTGSDHSRSMGGTQIWLAAGEQMSVSDMLKCVAVGMNDTHFVNASGLDAEGHVTSAYDVAMMSVELMKHEVIFDFTSIWMDSVRDGKFQLASTNKMLKTYDGLNGLKTGYTSQSGYSMSASATRGPMSLIAVVLGAKTKEARTADISAMLNYGFATYTSVTPSADTPLMPIPVKMGVAPAVPCRLADSTPILIEKQAISGIKKELSLMPFVSAPVEEGQQVGSLYVFSGEQQICEIPVIATEPVARLGFFGIWLMLLRTAAWGTK
ncbi:MAG: hypothetical protein ABT01_08135 [Clostridium sp. SCN 57-10]|nr:MAG: hypothetical protein ABT01_08135 [Clostridium sp. SCN 57-10]